MIDTEAPHGESPASLCRNDTLRLALERPAWSPSIHDQWPERFRRAVKSFLLLTSRKPPAATCDAHDGEDAKDGRSGEEGKMDACSCWWLPSDVVHSIVARMAYPVSDWVLTGDWEPPDPLLK